MADVAQLGIAVDSTQVKAGSDQLRVFESVARRTGETVDQVQARFAIATKSFASAGVEAGKTGATLNALAQQHAKVAATTEKVANATGLARHELINLSRQAQDVAVSLGSGQSPFTVLLQQGTQVADIFASSKTGTVGGAMKQIGGAVLNAITPFRALIAVTAASGAAAYAAYNSWKDYALKIDDVARVSQSTSRAMSSLTTAAAFKGISNDDFLEQFRRFSLNVDEAKDGVGTLAMQFRFMGQGIGSTQQAFERIAEAVKNAGSDQERIQILQNAGLPITRQWIDLMSQGAAGIREAQKAAREFGGTINDELVLKAKAFEQAWNSAIENIKVAFRGMFVDLSQYLDRTVLNFRQEMINFARYLPEALRPNVAQNFLTDNMNARRTGYSAGSQLGGNTSVDQFYNFGGAPGFKAGNDNGGETDEQRRARTLRSTIEANQRFSQSIGILGDLATTEQLVAAKAAELSNQFLQTGASAGKMQEAVLNAVRAQSDWSRMQQQAAFGVYDFAAANKAAAETLQYWKDKRLITTPEQAAAAQTYLARTLRDTADAAKVAASNFPQLQNAINQATDTYKAIDQAASSAIPTLTTGITDVIDNTKDLKTGFTDMSKTVIRAIEEMIVKMYIVAPIMNSLKSGLSALGSGSGFLGLFGGGTVASAKGNIFDRGNVIPFASGGVITRPHVFPMGNGGIGLAGEAGPEAIIPLRRGADGRLGVSAPGGNGGNVSIVINNNTPAQITQTETPDGFGGRRIELTMSDAAATGMNVPGGAADRSLRARGAAPLLKRR